MADPLPCISTRIGSVPLEGEQVSFAGGQHGSLRKQGVERDYRVGTSDSDVPKKCRFGVCAADVGTRRFVNFRVGRMAISWPGGTP